MSRRLFLAALTTAVFQASFAQNASPYWSLAGNSNASASSKLGTTNNISLRLFTSNTERLRIDSIGRVLIGTTAARGKFTLLGNGAAPLSKWILSGSPVFTSFAEGTGGNGDHILAMASNTVTARPNIIARRARGTLAVPTAVVANDYLSSFQASGYDGFAFQNPANIDFFVDGNMSAGNVPARISFSTGTNLSNRKERLVIRSDGDVNFNNGQMYLQQSTRNVGIGVLNPYYSWKLQVMGDSSYNTVIMAQSTFRGAANRTGVYGIAMNGEGYGVGVSGSGGYLGIDGYGEGGDYRGSVFGVSAFASGTVGYRYGVSGTAGGGDNTYGIYGVAFGGNNFNAAGYFNGDVWAAAYNTISDRRFKETIKPLEHALGGLMKLHPTSYEFKKGVYKNMHLPHGKQLGLIADEVKEVFPELVTAAVHPAEYDKETRVLINPEVKYEGVNYQGLIPVLIASVQEQQHQIEAQHAKIEKQQNENNDLRKELSELKAIVAKLVQGNATVSLANATLGIASPNPSKGITTIAYNIPTNSVTAQLLLTDMKGATIKRIHLSNGGNQVQLNTASLAAGTYTYSLFVEGVKMDSKQLLIAR